jgi:hypothetical protein
LHNTLPLWGSMCAEYGLITLLFGHLLTDKYQLTLVLYAPNSMRIRACSNSQLLVVTALRKLAIEIYIYVSW